VSAQAETTTTLRIAKSARADEAAVLSFVGELSGNTVAWGLDFPITEQFHGKVGIFTQL